MQPNLISGPNRWVRKQIGNSYEITKAMVKATNSDLEPRFLLLIVILLKRATEDSPLYFRLKNTVKTQANTIAVLCDLDQAEMLLQVAKHFCPDAVPQIEKAIRLARFP